MSFSKVLSLVVSGWTVVGIQCVVTVVPRTVRTLVYPLLKRVLVRAIVACRLVQGGQERKNGDGKIQNDRVSWNEIE